MATGVLIHGAADSAWYWRLLAAKALRRERDQSATPMEKPWPLRAWPNVPTRFLLCRDDRFFPAEFTRRVVREWLGINRRSSQFAEERIGAALVADGRGWAVA